MYDRRREPRPSAAVLVALALLLAATPPAPAVEFDRVVIDGDFPGAYQVEVADVDGDGRPDVVAVGGGTCAWYQNPTWKKRVVTTPKQTPGIISSATADITGDGKAEIALAYEFSMNEPKKGKLLLASQGATPDDPWTLAPVDDVPSIHRLRWMTFGVRVGPGNIEFLKEGEGKPWEKQLVVAPIFGASARPPRFQEEPARLYLYAVGDGSKSAGLGVGPGGAIRPADTEAGPRVPHLINKKEGGGFRAGAGSPVLHAIDVVTLPDHDSSDILGASNLGVTRTFVDYIAGAPHYGTAVLVPGAPGEAPKTGCSEVHVGRLKDGRRFLATVEPWHGTEVAVYATESLKPLKFGPRAVIDATLKDGHALWVADVDGDGDDEVFAGYRGGGGGVLVFDHDPKTRTWARAVVDASVTAQDLRGGDLDGDGRPDVVAVGGQSHNVVWYRPRKK